MKTTFSVMAGSLAAVLRRVVSRASTLPVLGTVKLSDETDGIWAEASDLDRAWRERVPTEHAEASSGLALCVTHPTLLRLVSAFDGKVLLSITVDDEAKTLVLSGGGRRATLLGLPADEFPPGMWNGMPEWTAMVPVPVPALAEALGATLHAVSRDTTRHILNGLRFCAAEGGSGLVVVATDGRRLAVWSGTGLPLAAAGEDGAMTVPTEAALAMRGLIDRAGADDELRLARVGADRIALRLGAGGAMLVAKLIEGSYPNWRQVVPADGNHEKVLRVNRETLLDAVRWVAQIGTDEAKSEGGHQIRLIISSTGHLRVERQAADRGDGAVDVEPLSWSGKDGVRIALGARYLAETMASLQGEEVELRLDGEVTPVKIRSGVVTEIVMPMRIAG